MEKCPHGKKLADYLRDYAEPRIGRKRIDQINVADIMHILSPIWNDKKETAQKLRQRLSAIFKWSVAQGYRNDDPAGDTISKALPRSNGQRKHMKALPHSQVADALAKIRASGAYPGTKLAFEFLVLTACRSGEVRFAVWTEIDFEKAVWTILGERMKAGKEHRVPLSKRAVSVLEKARGVR